MSSGDRNRHSTNGHQSKVDQKHIVVGGGCSSVQIPTAVVINPQRQKQTVQKAAQHQSLKGEKRGQEQTKTAQTNSHQQTQTVDKSSHDETKNHQSANLLSGNRADLIGRDETLNVFSRGQASNVQTNQLTNSSDQLVGTNGNHNGVVPNVDDYLNSDTSQQSIASVVHDSSMNLINSSDRELLESILLFINYHSQIGLTCIYNRYSREEVNDNVFSYQVL